jgi:hypothetical protein
MALCQREQAGRHRSHLAGRWATCAPGGPLVPALGADVNDVPPFSAFFGAPIMCPPQFVKRRGFGPAVVPAFFGQRRAAHGRHPRQ